MQRALQSRVTHSKPSVRPAALQLWFSPQQSSKSRMPFSSATGFRYAPVHNTPPVKPPAALAQRVTEAGNDALEDAFPPRPLSPAPAASSLPLSRATALHFLVHEIHTSV